jgi:hypothetical protein
LVGLPDAVAIRASPYDAHESDAPFAAAPFAARKVRKVATFRIGEGLHLASRRTLNMQTSSQLSPMKFAAIHPEVGDPTQYVCPGGVVARPHAGHCAHVTLALEVSPPRPLP